MKPLDKLICYYKGHISLQRKQEYKSIYYLLKNSGAFCRGVTYVYEGRLYRCSRCGELCVLHGVTSWELEDLISVTLQDVVPIYHNIFKNVDYSVCRIYRSSK